MQCYKINSSSLMVYSTTSALAPSLFHQRQRVMGLSNGKPVFSYLRRLPCQKQWQQLKSTTAPSAGMQQTCHWDRVLERRDGRERQRHGENLNCNSLIPRVLSLSHVPPRDNRLVPVEKHTETEREREMLPFGPTFNVCRIVWWKQYDSSTTLVIPLQTLQIWKHWMVMANERISGFWTSWESY